MGTKERSGVLGVVLKLDELCTKTLVAFVFLCIPVYKLRPYCKYLEISCNGTAWLAGWLAFICIANNKSLYQMQFTLLFGLILDIIIIAVLKAKFRRRRPTMCSDMLGRDKFSFPSGYASRSAFIYMFFTVINPVPESLWMYIFSWTLGVCLSRILLRRHYILDVLGGIGVGIVEALILGLEW
uniref:Presqualene diphosphate phosphatase n=1 Tax=Bactrocera dorsalis TaxID=27457 RepID=A0A034VV90_BACDO